MTFGELSKVGQAVLLVLVVGVTRFLLAICSKYEQSVSDFVAVVHVCVCVCVRACAHVYLCARARSSNTGLCACQKKYDTNSIYCQLMMGNSLNRPTLYLTILYYHHGVLVSASRYTG